MGPFSIGDLVTIMTGANVLHSGETGIITDCESQAFPRVEFDNGCNHPVRADLIANTVKAPANQDAPADRFSPVTLLYLARDLSVITDPELLQVIDAESIYSQDELVMLRNDLPKIIQHVRDNLA